MNFQKLEGSGFQFLQVIVDSVKDSYSYNFNENVDVSKHDLKKDILKGFKLVGPSTIQTSNGCFKHSTHIRLYEIIYFDGRETDYTCIIQGLDAEYFASQILNHKGLQHKAKLLNAEIIDL